MASKGVIRLGDPTTGGGHVISTPNTSHLSEGKLVAVYGAQATCQRHNGTFPFVEAAHSHSWYGQGVILHGHKLACGCSAISTCPVSHVVEDVQPVFAKAAPLSPSDAELAQAAHGDPHELTADTGDGSSTPRRQHLLINLRIGVFFDGTGNNEANSAIGEHCRAQSKGDDEKQALLAGCEHAGDDSYGNAPSNVAKLFELYHDSIAAGTPLAPNGSYYLKLYVDGIGTTAGLGDSLEGFGMGTGATGIVARVEDAFYQDLAEVLRRFLREQDKVWLDTIQFDVFGFSRGAAAARHFVHRVNKKNMGPLAHALIGARAKLKPGFNWKSDASVNFVGLFDTVAMLGGSQTTGETWYSPLYNVYLELPSGCASKVVQLCARDEHRMNFPLTSCAPPFSDTPLPGAHSDIGGGYPPDMQEKLWLVKPIITMEPAALPVEASRAYSQASKQLPVLRAQDPVYAQSMEVVTWTGPSIARRTVGWGSTSMRAVGASVQLRRTVSNAYSLIPLRIMHALATDAGVPTTSIPAGHAYEVPSDLKPIADKLMAYAKGGGAMNLSPAEERLLRERYLHHSDSWNPLRTWMSESGPDIYYTNRPTEDGKRQVFPNEGKP